MNRFPSEDLHNSLLTSRDLAFSEGIHKKASHDQLRESYDDPGVISSNNEPWGALTCRSPTLAVLAYSGPFHGLLLTILGSRSDFHD